MFETNKQKRVMKANNGESFYLKNNNNEKTENLITRKRGKLPE